ncbi:hypothetical protein TNCV_4053291 [Trichonephila clavipes]|nr:hypothetical protein TNCV_4053291 [Trichonephila clavipes]
MMLESSNDIPCLLNWRLCGDLAGQGNMSALSVNSDSQKMHYYCIQYIIIWGDAIKIRIENWVASSESLRATALDPVQLEDRMTVRNLEGLN